MISMDSFLGVDAVLTLQNALLPFDSTFEFISEASNPASVLIYVVAIISAYDTFLAANVLAAYGRPLQCEI